MQLLILFVHLTGSWGAHIFGKVLFLRVSMRMSPDEMSAGIGELTQSSGLPSPMCVGIIESEPLRN